MERLNVGCGNDYREGWTNLDFNKNFKPDVSFDINEIYKDKKLPFKDNTFDLIILYDVLEHFPEPLPILRELYRVCKIGGIIEIKVPYGELVWGNLDHKRMFLLGSFDMINFDHHASSKERNVQLEEMKLYTITKRSIIKRGVYSAFLKIINIPVKKKKYVIYDQLLKNIFPDTNIYVKYRKIS